MQSGRIELNEKPQKAAVRESLEKSGYKIKIERSQSTRTQNTKK